MSNRTLGLDLGPNSIGWALIDEEQQKIVDVGVRIFPEGVDNFDTKKEKSRNEARRVARGMRRQTKRRSRRKRQLREALISIGFFPSDPVEQRELLQMDPYALRVRALDEKLSPYEIGRVLLHLNQRRGFKSNKKEDARAEAKAKRRKADTKPKPDSEKKTEDILLEMAELEKAIEQSGARTLGEYLRQKIQSISHQYRKEDDHVRGRHTLRRMLIKEFDEIWRNQSEFHPELLTEELAFGKIGRQKVIQRPIPKCDRRREHLDEIQPFIKKYCKTVPEKFASRTWLCDLMSFGLFGLIFFHRTLKPVPREIVGLCELEPKQRRCARADRRAQRFRLLQEINNLRFIDPLVNAERALDEEQREVTLAYMSTREKATFEDLRKKLGLIESVKFNLERGKRSGIKGMEVDCLMAKAMGKRWYALSEKTKNGVVDALIRSVDEDETHERLVNEFELTGDMADAALAVDLPDGYGRLSLVAIERLLPHLERGLVYEHSDPAKSARAAAGYDEPWALHKRIFDKLPDPRRTKDCPIGDIPNPVVKRTLVELRKVLNAILREYGRPDEVHVEMGRDVKTRPKDKRSPAYWKYKEEEDVRAEREAKRTAAKEKLRENNKSFGAAGRNILKYLLWQEQGQVCIYSGKSISFTQLLSDDIEMDHILPYSQSLDDSAMNKVVCFRRTPDRLGNADKGQQTPRQWLEDARPDVYEKVCQRAKKLSYAKYKRFLRKDAKIDDFIDRQLNDTRYIAKATVEYLKCLFAHDDNKAGAVLGLKGQQTSTLRRGWGLDTILSDLPDSLAWQEQSNLRFGEKNRADHRHHAIDAVVIALTTRSRLQKLAAGFTVAEFVDRQTGEIELHTAYRGDKIEMPWEYLRDEVKDRISQLNVSHRVERKVAGGLHEDTKYGPTPEPDVFVSRKFLKDGPLSYSEIDNIRDDAIKQAIVDRLAEHDIEYEPGMKGKPNPAVWKLAFADPENPARMNSRNSTALGMPIHRVRIKKRDATIQLVRQGQPGEAYVKPGATHHLCIFEWEENGKAKHDAEYVSRLEACQRIRNREPLVRRHHSQKPNARFLMSLCPGDLVLIQRDDESCLMVVSTLVSTEKKIGLVYANDARRSDKKWRTTPRLNGFMKMSPRKVTVDPLGRIRWAND